MDDFQVPEALTPAGFARVQQDDLESEISTDPPSAWRASALGNPCDRALVWAFTKPEQIAPYSYRLQAIFNEGKLHHADVYEKLERRKYKVHRESRKTVRFKFGNCVISGRMDGAISGYKDERYEPAWSLEIKSAQDYAWQRYDTIADVNASDYWRTAGYATQLNVYNFLEDLPHGVLVMKSKSTGLLKVIPAPLDYERAEAVLQRVERLQGMVDRKEDPPPILWSATTCGQCPFKAVCYPAKDYGQGMVTLPVSGDFLVALEREIELKQAHAEYDKLHKRRNTLLKELGTFEMAMVGPFLIRRKEVKVRGYPVEPRTDIRFEITRVEETKQIEET